MDTRTWQPVFLDRETSRDLGTEPCPLYVVYVRREGWIMVFFYAMYMYIHMYVYVHKSKVRPLMCLYVYHISMN